MARIFPLEESEYGKRSFRQPQFQRLQLHLVCNKNLEIKIELALKLENKFNHINLEILYPFLKISVNLYHYILVVSSCCFSLETL